MSAAIEFSEPGYQESLDIAVVGMAGRFPGAANIEEFWKNLKNGTESISFFSDETVVRAGVKPELIQNPHYVKAGGVLEGVELFDAGFFGFYPREAQILDPQHRILLECAHEALEHAGCNPDSYPGLIGVFAGTGMSTYLLYNLLSNREIRESVHPYQLTIGNDKDFLATRISYKLNLRGPSVTVQTACSTSLVAVHVACQNLLSYQCDMALAGGVSILLPQQRGYLYQEGGIASPDGHCRAFDAKAAGTVGGNGAGIVVLKRLADAVAEGDMIHAVIKGSAFNNDGAVKVGYTAPGVDGQAAAIATALAVANVGAESIRYIEAHGTGTAMGDPIEIAALTQVFRAATEDRHFCAIGSVKTNIGHLDAAAGVTGLIKTVLALENRFIPASLHFESPNPKIDFENSPFYVNAAPAEWLPSPDGVPRRAAVSSFGIGGTNAHVVLEEAPALPEPASARSWHMALLSARNDSALERLKQDWIRCLESNPGLSPADAAFTTHVGRKHFARRAFVVGRSTAEWAAGLRSAAHADAASGCRTAFMFTGQGSQRPGMALELYRAEPVFREELDRCAELLNPHLGLDLRSVLYPENANEQDSALNLNQTWLAQPALFAIEYALARLWMEWEVQPAAMIGHSIGEYVAACISGVFSLEDALALVSLRGRLMQKMIPGAMLVVPMAESEILPCIGADLSLAAVNAPTLCIVSGPEAAIAEFERILEQKGLAGQRLHTSHAFHSAMMDPVLDVFSASVASMRLSPPEIPFISNVSGDWIKPEEAVEPGYWARHLRRTVRFADGIGKLLEDRMLALLEVGPGTTLAYLARCHPDSAERLIASSLPDPRKQNSECGHILSSLGKLWQAGIPVNWAGYHARESRRRIPLPTYPFERRKYWVDPDDVPAGSGDITQAAASPAKKDISEWLYSPSWKRAGSIGGLTGKVFSEKHSWFLFGSENLGSSLAARLIEHNQDVRTLFASGNSIQDETLRRVLLENSAPAIIICCCTTDDAAGFDDGFASGYHNLLSLARVLSAERTVSHCRLVLITRSAAEVTGEEELCPGNAMAVGLLKVVAQECAHLICRSIDLADADLAPARILISTDAILQEAARGDEPQIAVRGGYRWIPVYEKIAAENQAQENLLRPHGTYLITGGLGRIGLEFAEFLAASAQANLILVDRTTLPAAGDWHRWLDSHPDNDAVSQKMRKIRLLQEAGSTVVIECANVSAYEDMHRVFESARRDFGAINGVIYGAGLVGSAALRSIQETGPAESEAQFEAKVKGLLLLDEMIGSHPIDFCLLQSSLSTVLGGLGLGAYAAANSYMDAFAHRKRRSGNAPWIAVNWDGWNFGESASLPAMPGTELSITPAQGRQVLNRILGLCGVPQVIVSTGDLQSRLENWVRLKGNVETIPGEPSRQPEAGAPPGCAPPRNETERTILSVWQSILGIKEIGIHDSFFELGGHSLLATQLVSRLRDTFKTDLPLRRMFDNPTVAGLAQAILAERPESGGTTAPAITRISREGNLPVSFGQQRLWFLDQLEPDSALYNNFAAVRISGELNFAALDRCLKEIVKRHEILRTAFKVENGQPVQRIIPEVEIALEWQDISNIEKPRQEIEIQRLAVEEARQPFQLSKAPLMRSRLLRLGDREHVIFLTMHHIVTDGWSVRVLLKEIAALYPAYAAGLPSPLPELPIQFADYAVWEREWLKGERLESQLNYWKERLKNAPAGLDIPTGRTRPAIQTARGASVWFNLDPELTEGIAALNRQEGTTTFMVLLAALKILLHRLTGGWDICIGTPAANRSRVETEDLIGFILNTLVLRTDLSGHPSAREVLHRVRETALSAYANQDAPFEMLVSELHPERDMSRSPFFQVIFDLQESALQSLKVADLVLEPIRVDLGISRFDLALSMEQGEFGLGGFFNYNADLFDAETVGRVIAGFKCLLQGIVENPDSPISSMPILTEDEEEDLLAPSIGNDGAASPACPVFRSFSENAGAAPDRVALVFENASWTYAELNSRANQLAHYLQRTGLSCEKVAGICLDRSPEMIVAVLAVMKAGGAVLPLDPAFPAERLNLMLEDAGASLLITQASRSDLFAKFGGGLVLIDMNREAIASQSSSDPEVSLDPDSLVYIIYTSGSTGIPKGVMISHRALADHCREARRHYGIEPADRVLQFSSLSFDPAFEQMFTAFTAGAMLVLRGEDLWIPSELHEEIEKSGLTVVNFPPAYWRQWAEYASAESVRVLKDLKTVIVGGDVMKAESLPFWNQSPMRGVRLLNAYGPTETTITALTCEVAADMNDSAVSPAGIRRIPVGRPLAGRRAYIVDRDGNLLPKGIAGELWIGGAGMARGYLRQPELTADRFVPDEFSGEPGARCYRTGDIARMRADGNLEFLGRIDQQVKVRGFRVEPGEIEAVLAAHPGVQLAAVVVADMDGEASLVAYVEQKNSPPLEPAELCAYLEQRLPNYMVPSDIAVVRELPKTPGGKIDRGMLPKIKTSRGTEKSFEAPRTPLEVDLAARFAEVLHVERVGLNDSFFELGGHSLLATRLVSRLREDYAVELPLRRLFETPTVSGLASLITKSLAMRETDEELSRLLKELEELPDEEVEALLGKDDTKSLPDGESLAGKRNWIYE